MTRVGLDSGAAGASLAPYPTPEGRQAALHRCAAEVGAELVEYGHSVDGEPLVAARVPASVRGQPRVLCTANIHGLEFIGGQVAMGLLGSLAPRGQGEALRRQAEVWVIPCLNPDGFRRTWAQHGAGPLVGLRPNAHGVDLNRNFPLPRGRPTRMPGAGSDRPGDATYRGPAPLSEPETAALDRLLATERFHASANLHSFMGTLIPARVTDRPNYGAYRELCRAFANGQPRARYRRLAHRIFDVFTGEQEDHQHHRHRCWSVCVEVFPIAASYRQHLRAPATFWRFNPREPATWVANDVPGLLAYFSAALARAAPRSDRDPSAQTDS